MINKLLKNEAIKYLIFGVLTTAVNFICYTIFIKVCKMNVDLSNIIAIIISILFAYVTNKLFVFNSHQESFKEVFNEFIKFISSRLITMLIEVVGVYVLVTVMKGDPLIGKLATQVIVIIGNYVLSKWVVFK